MSENHKLESNQKDWQTGTAYIVETREHPNLQLVLENVDSCFPKGWRIIVFCVDENFFYVNQILSTFVERSVNVIKLKKGIKSLQDYNELLLSNWFWQNFETENLFGFQVDSLINENQKNQLAKIAEYDYVGAPWSERIQRRWDYIPAFGGNGGICFSKKSARLHVLKSATQTHFIGEPHNQELNEGLWFSHAFNELNCSLPERSFAKKMFVESVYSQSPFAVHKPWCYLSSHDYQSLSIELPKLNSIRKGCEIKGEDIAKISNRRFLLRFARQCLSEKNYYQADLAIQVCQSRFPEDVVAYNLQSTLAYHLGLFEQANTFVNTALTLKPNFKKAVENKSYIDKELKKTHSNTNNDSERYILIHSWGSGLGFDLLYLLKQLMVAELTERKPMVYWGKNSLYNNDSEADSFTDYFEPISDVKFDDIEKFHQSCFPEFWQKRELKDYIRRTRWRSKSKQQHSLAGIYFLNRDEPLVVGGEFTTVKMLQPWIPLSHRIHGMSVSDIYRDLMEKYIRPKSFLQKRANLFVLSEFNKQPYVAIHLRGTDKQQEKQSRDIATINQELITQLEQLNSSLLIFVMTDDVRQIKAMEQRFGSRVRSVNVTRSDGDMEGVHHTANDKQKIAEEVIVDMLIATQADYFFGCGFSYLACCVNAFRSKQQHSVLYPFDLTTRFYDVPHSGTFDIY